MSKKPNKKLDPYYGHSAGMMDRINISIHLRRYIKMLKSRWPFVILTAILGTAYMGFKAFGDKTFFQGKSIIGITSKIRIPGEKRVEYLKPAPTYWTDLSRSMDSDTVWSRTLEQVKEDHPPPADVEVLSKGASRLGKSSSFQLTVNSNNESYAKQLAAYWVTNFVHHKDLKTLEEFTNKQASLEKNKTKWIRNLADVQKEYDELILKHGATGNENLVTPIREVIVSINRELDRTEIQLQKLELTAKEDYAQFVSSGASSSSPLNSTANQLTEPFIKDTNDERYRKIAKDSSYRKIVLELAGLTEEWEKQSKLLKTQHPYMVDLSSQIEEFNAQKNRLLVLATTELDNSIHSLKTTQKLLKSQIKNREEELKIALIKQQELYQKFNEIENAKNRLEEYTQLLAFFQEEPESEFYEILASGVVEKIDPQRVKKILQGLMFGLALGLGIVYLLQRLDDRMELAEDIETALELPVLGQIPQMNLKDMNQDRILISNLEKHNVFSESLRGVRSAIMFDPESKKNQIIAVTSAIPGDGKTTFTVNFAATMASAGHRVLLVDADMRRGNIHNYFETDRSPGLSELLNGELHWADVINSTPIETLETINTGRLPNNPGELLVSPITQQFLDEARNHYEYIIIDSPPVTAIDDTFSFVKIVDAFTFIVKAGETPMRFAKNAINEIIRRGAYISGIVVNGIKPDNPSYYYTYYYHAYYNKGLTEMPEEEPGDGPMKAPARTMAAPKKESSIEISIQAAARKKAEETRSPNDFPALAPEPALEADKRKAELFKSRRAAKRRAKFIEISLGSEEHFQSAPLPSPTVFEEREPEMSSKQA